MPENPPDFEQNVSHKLMEQLNRRRIGMDPEVNPDEDPNRRGLQDFLAASGLTQALIDVALRYYDMGTANPHFPVGASEPAPTPVPAGEKPYLPLRLVGNDSASVGEFSGTSMHDIIDPSELEQFRPRSDTNPEGREDQP